MRKNYDFSKAIKNPYARRLRSQASPSVGRIVASVTVENALDRSKSLKCRALVDTAAAFLVLPTAWRDRLGELHSTKEIEIETTAQGLLPAEVCGAVRIEIEGFRPISSEVAFAEIEPANGEYEPLIGYIVLQQSLARIDTLGHRLVRIKHLDLK